MKKVFMATATLPWKQLLLNAIVSNSHLRQQLDLPGDLPIELWFSGDLKRIVTGFKSTLNPVLNKIKDLKHCPIAEICWYFTDSWEQFRINGRVDVIDCSNADPMKLQQREREHDLPLLSNQESRLQYLGPDPGCPRLTEQSLEESHLNNFSGPLAPYCLLVTDPKKVDYYNLKSSQRIMFTSNQSVHGEENCWTSEGINP